MTTDVEELARTIVDLRKRLESLERATQLDHSSVTGDDGTTVNAATAILAGSKASTDAAVALASLVDVQAIADNKVTVFYSSTAPTEADDNPEYNDQWLVVDAPVTYLGTTYLVGTLLRYDGDTWLLSQQSSAAALAAAQNAQATADGKIDSYWQDTAPPTAAEGDLWYKTAALLPGETVPRVLAVSRWSAGAWIPLPLTSGTLVQGGIDPGVLTVGVTGNLFQDPRFVTNLRTPPTYWTIQPPDALPSPATGSNYLRATGTASTHTPSVGSGSSDTTFYLTDRIPVDAGRTVRVAAQFRGSAAVLTQGTPNAYARLRVAFYKADGSVVSSGTQLVQTDLVAESIPADTWTPIEGRFGVPDGYSSVVVMFQTTYHRAGTIDFIAPEVQVLWDRVQSSDYAESSSGWVLDSENTQFESVNVIDTIGANSISANSISIGGQDLATDYLSPLPLGIVAYDVSLTGSHSGTATTAGTEYRIFEFAMGAAQPGRLYRIRWDGHLVAANTDDVFDLRLRYTTDGTAPTISSNLMRSKRFTIGSVTTSTGFDIEKVFAIGAFSENVRFWLSLTHVAGAGSGYIYNTGTDRVSVVYVEDCGLSTAAQVAGTLSQKSIAIGGPPADPDPVNSYTKSWTSTWGRSFDGDLGTRNGDDTADLYQGYYSSTHGNTRSLFGFDYAAIQSALSGATITKVTLAYRVKHAWGGAGIAVQVSSHNYTSKPATWSSGSVSTGRAAFSAQKEGASYTQTLPVAIGNEFKSGTTRGLGFGPGPSNTTSAYYGYMYAAPKLTISYTK